ncbi:hypothetical protein SAY87_001414 [Trapa incisa]|uniref:Uncharacterized protein n=1 Tax=Trapa incisa TaxID=236973 RepID=A0AAN7GG39_9MYRT|nr:hypothetical protein SAY87_001414 [Trapa incisa]
MYVIAGFDPSPNKVPRRLLWNKPLFAQPSAAVEDAGRDGRWASCTTPTPPQGPAIDRLRHPMVTDPSHAAGPIGDLPPPVLPPLGHGQGRFPAPHRRELPLRPLDLVAPPAAAAVLALHRLQHPLVHHPVVDLRGAGVGPRCEDLRPVVHQGEEVPLLRCQP